MMEIMFPDFPKKIPDFRIPLDFDGFPGTYPEERTWKFCKVYFIHVYT